MKTKHVSKVDEWYFEIKLIRAIKTPEFGMPYTATALISIVNGEPVVENLLSVDDFTRKDFKAITSYLETLGFDKLSRRRFSKEGIAKDK